MNHDPIHDTEPGQVAAGMLDRPTLDDEQTQHMSHQLAAAVRTADARPSPTQPRRLVRIVGGVAAAAVLGIGAVAVTSLTDQPAPAAAAVRVTDADGWTSVDFIDTRASAQEIHDELESSGIDAEIVDLDDLVASDPDEFTVNVGPPPEGQTRRYVGILEVSTGDQPTVSSGGVSGILVELPEPIPSVDLSGGSAEEAMAARAATLEPLGVRIPLAGTTEVSIRNGADVTVLLVER
jgi:hypothetical protein